MTQWVVGMLAVCVDGSDCKNTGTKSPFTSGKVYRVSDVQTNLSSSNGATCTGLAFFDILIHEGGFWNAKLFRPAVQDNKKADEKFTALIKGRVKA